MGLFAFQFVIGFFRFVCRFSPLLLMDVINCSFLFNSILIN
jgi:hypothetical protein